MESLEIKVAYTVRTSVAVIEERFHQHYISGAGPDATFNAVSMGWFIGFDGSHELLFFGMERPAMKVDDKVHITFTKES